MTESPIRPTVLYGLVLAGGRSRRFGDDKALASLDGRPLLEIAVERLRRACSETFVSARRGSEAAQLARALGAPVLHDGPGDPPGPLAGLTAGIARIACRGRAVLAVTPCDTPLLPDDLYARLHAALQDAEVAVARTPEGLQPLCSVWRPSVLPVLSRTLGRGRSAAVKAVLEQVAVREVVFDDADAFANINTRDELASVAARSAAAVPPQAAAG